MICQIWYLGFLAPQLVCLIWYLRWYVQFATANGFSKWIYYHSLVLDDPGSHSKFTTVHIYSTYDTILSYCILKFFRKKKRSTRKYCLCSFDATIAIFNKYANTVGIINILFMLSIRGQLIIANMCLVYISIQILDSRSGCTYVWNPGNYRIS